METKTYPLYTLDFPVFEEKSKNEPEYFQIVRWDRLTMKVLFSMKIRILFMKIKTTTIISIMCCN